jgi:hypothetical protein
MFKRALFLGITSGVLAGIGGEVYNRIYHFATETDFSRIINPVSIFSVCIGACVLASTGYWAFDRLFRHRADIIFNLVFAIATYATIMSPLTMKLPLDIQNPELFPGLAIPMHFLPILAWLVLKPVFIKSQYAKIR